MLYINRFSYFCTASVKLDKECCTVNVVSRYSAVVQTKCQHEALFGKKSATKTKNLDYLAFVEYQQHHYFVLDEELLCSKTEQHLISFSVICNTLFTVPLLKFQQVAYSKA